MARTNGRMNSTSQLVGQEAWFRARPKFLVGCAAVVAVLFLPEVIAHSRIVKEAVLLLAVLAILIGWWLLLRDSGSKTNWRTVTAFIASVYLVASLPVFIFELSQAKWFIQHPWHSLFSMYALPWIRWGYIFIYLSVICSLLGRGRARIAFVTGSVLLMVLRQAMGTWVF